MLDYISIIKIITISVVLYYLTKCLKRLSNSSRYSILIIFSVLYAMPIALDLFYMANDYKSSMIGFVLSQNDYYSNIIYCIFVIFTVILLYKRPIKKQPISRLYSGNDTSTLDYRILIGVSILAPLYVIIVQNDINYLYAFNWRELHLLDIPKNYLLLEKLTYLGVSSSVLLMLSKSTNSVFVRLLAFLCLYANICIEGKRAILFFALINIALFIILYQPSYMRTKKAIPTIGVIVLIFTYYMVSTSISTKVERGYQSGNEEMYTTLRIDFFRDDRVKMAIFSDLNPDKIQIGQYPFQSIISEVSYFEPINTLLGIMHLPIAEQRNGYQTLFTAGLEGHKGVITPEVRESCSYMTVSVFAELITNFGILFGILLSPFLCLFFVKLIDTSGKELRFLLYNTFVLMNLFSIDYCILYIEFTFVFYYLKKSRYQLIDN